jgi:hypothetical protein
MRIRIEVHCWIRISNADQILPVLRIQIRMDPHHLGKLDPYSEQHQE